MFGPTDGYQYSVPVYFSNDEVQGTGHVWNMSLDGCRIDGNIEIQPGMTFSLLMMPAENEPAIIVDQARVAWARGPECGLRIKQIQPREAKRLRRIVTARIT